jgi:hypothetical protein
MSINIVRVSSYVPTSILYSFLVITILTYLQQLPLAATIRNIYSRIKLEKEDQRRNAPATTREPRVHAQLESPYISRQCSKWYITQRQLDRPYISRLCFQVVHHPATTREPLHLTSVFQVVHYPATTRETRFHVSVFPSGTSPSDN